MAPKQSEIHNALNDPNVAVEIAVGPPFAQLVPQKQGSGLVIGHHFVTGTQPKRFIMKKAHLSNDDYRVWESPGGQLIAVSHHLGKNPYDALDPLGVSNAVQHHNNKLGEWESICHVSGYRGMPAIKIRPKTASMHGRQYVQDNSGNQTFCNVGKESRLKSLSIRHNLAVRRGKEKELLYRILIDMAGRTMQIVNPEGEMVAFVTKTVEALLLNAAFGHGSELSIDVAPGVDWSAMLAIVLATKQVGAHFVKDAVGNFVVSPLQGAAVDYAVDAVGAQTQVAQAGKATDQGLKVVKQLQQIYNQFYK
ncbi:hypothetical protein HYH03_007127 [Edaphochlamys debaryana]|uniref:Uncharacterized protein n=1 Tax=Edaphochlamys debaryana TaxID=47281 RepID=A0A836C0W0_9CHLO|nr:hypothetical protein HYH03_007127 [Edaphochlamys debaryana]|eukprot:KAG2494889.1 hypothetical protein HYH03_007127 [Edaphochlamys debaryana]